MTFWEQLKDAFNRFFGYTGEQTPVWKIIVISAAMIGLIFIFIWDSRGTSELDDESDDEGGAK